VAQIMDARAATVTAISLKLAQADALASQREVVARAAITKPVTAAGDEERLRCQAEQAITLAGLGVQSLNDAAGQWKQPLLAELATTDAQQAFIKIDVAGIEAERLADCAGRWPR